MNIRADHCQYDIDGTRIISDVSMAVSPGEVVSLIGANGAGKSTLLKLLSGELRATQGEVFLNDKSIHKFSLEERARQLAVLPQKSGLDFPFLVEEVIEMGRYPQLTGAAFDRQIVNLVVRRLALTPFLRRRYTSLSGGERQRVQIARVLAQMWDRPESACYLFDEPTAALDLAHQLAFFQLVRSLAKAGAAVLLVIHDINLASRFSDRLILLREGHLIADGSPNEVITRSHIKTVFEVDVEVIPAEGERSIQISY